MSTYTPPFSISNKMLSLVSSISEKIGKISNYNDFESKPQLRKNNRIKSIHSSLAIEANSLSLSAVRDVINGHIVLGPQKEIQEVKNAYDAYEKLSEINPFSVYELKKFHGIMTYALVNESGKFRNGEEGVFDGDKCIFMAPPAHLVPALTQDLFDWMNRENKNVHPLILSSIFHYEFVFIHPFSDGNGRMARLWQTAILAKWKPIFQYIPIESQIQKYQTRYYDSISKCHVAGNSDLFIEFMLEMIDEILSEIISQSTSENSHLSEYVKRLLDVMEFDIPYTSAEIISKLNLKSKETFRKNYLNPAIEMNLIQMTVPDKPTSRNQRYIKK
jgi:Fic family protein